jgi:hypothetical protein
MYRNPTLVVRNHVLLNLGDAKDVGPSHIIDRRRYQHGLSPEPLSLLGSGFSSFTSLRLLHFQVPLSGMGWILESL